MKKEPMRKTRTGNHDAFDGFTVSLARDEDGDWLAHFVEQPQVSAFADTPERALLELRTAWEGVKQSYRKHGEALPVAPSQKHYSGQFNVRIDKRLHRALALEAEHAGVSLNALVAQKLAKATRTG